MLARFAAAVLLPIVSAQAFAASPAQICGTWTSDDGRGYSEVQFRADHSFTLFTRMSLRNPTLAIAQVAEQFGTWRIAGDRLKLESTQRWSNKREPISLRFRLRQRSLAMQSVFYASRTDTYSRMTIPPCTDTPSSADLPFDEQKMLGKWRGHYRTHDAEFSFEPGRHVSLYWWDLGDRRKFEEATWHLKKNTIIINPTKDASDFEIKWQVMRAGDGCLVVSDGYEMSYTLHRVE
jgi:hypothetical protein